VVNHGNFAEKGDHLVIEQHEDSGKFPRQAEGNRQKNDERFGAYGAGMCIGS